MISQQRWSDGNVRADDCSFLQHPPLPLLIDCTRCFPICNPLYSFSLTWLPFPKKGGGGCQTVCQDRGGGRRRRSTATLPSLLPITIGAIDAPWQRFTMFLQSFTLLPKFNFGHYIGISLLGGCAKIVPYCLCV